ncbi:MAG: hypothetical protein GOMPHAMPRED_005512 [Gomphillus americanus]|uniref:Uncharacterized protein n=1 Tax=Gomphillus americanus TaxID=1940652 RepID=A0A8H3FSF1_9LECA|nr:MAG: hypothetical protein GOMPHAMPRED_005512 [Gomphillus americanus]
MSSAEHTQSTPTSSTPAPRDAYGDSILHTLVKVFVHRRRPGEWPTFRNPNLNHLRSNQDRGGDTDSRIALKTLRFIDEELWQHMNTDLPLPEDDWIAAEMHKVPRDSQGNITDTKGVNVRGLMANAWFRAMEQSAVLEIWFAFRIRGLFSPEGLKQPISWYTNDTNVVQAARFLTFFSGIRSSIGGDKLFPNQQRIDNPWFWLAIQIVRCGVKPADMMSNMRHWIDALGSFDEAAFSQAYPHGIEWNHDPDAFSPARDQHMGARAKRYYAEWLPNPLGNRDDDPEKRARLVHNSIRRFESIEKRYCRYFSVHLTQEFW